MFCKGMGKRRHVSPNYSEESIKKFEYWETCPYCKGNGVCTYCKGTGKCWACGGTAKLTDDWKCLVKRFEDQNINFNK